jgi:hypothetical protein
MASHHQDMPLHQALVRSLAEDGAVPRAVAFNSDAFAYEAFNCTGLRTMLLQPLKAASLTDALAETTSRWSWDRGDRLAVREIGPKRDRLYVYAVRRKAVGVRPNFASVIEHARWLDHICTIDLNAIAGINVTGVGSEITIHEHDQKRRPEGARMERA